MQCWRHTSEREGKKPFDAVGVGSRNLVPEKVMRGSTDADTGGPNT